MIPISIITYVITYYIDMESSLLLRRKRRAAWDNLESNGYFGKVINQFGETKGRLVYAFTAGLQLLIMNLLAILIAYLLVFDNFSFLSWINLTFFYLSGLHLLGACTNIIALFKFRNIKNEKS